MESLLVLTLILLRHYAIISSTSIIADREQRVDFTGKYYDTPSQIVLNKNIKTDGSLSSLKGKKLGGLKASTQENYAKGEFTKVGVEILSCDAQDQVYLAIKAGHLDGAVVDIIEVRGAFLDTADGKDYVFFGPTLAAFMKYFVKGDEELQFANKTKTYTWPWITVRSFGYSLFLFAITSNSVASVTTVTDQQGFAVSRDSIMCSHIGVDPFP